MSRDATTYLVDSNNHTGYAQVVQERQGASPTLDFVLGDDVLGFAFQTGAQRAYLYDGHGSVRGTATLESAPNAPPDQGIDYDAYGNVRLGTHADFTPPAPESALGYSGEWSESLDDANTTLVQESAQYLRARWYDPGNGRFNRMDPFAGVNTDPQSLHKYVYVHGDPVNGIDPSGMLSLTQQLTVGGIVTVLLSVGFGGITKATGGTWMQAFHSAFLGLIAGAALSLAYFTGKIKLTSSFTEVLTSAFSAGLGLLCIEFLLEMLNATQPSIKPFGEYPTPSIQKVMAFQEGFAWGAVSSILNTENPWLAAVLSIGTGVAAGIWDKLTGRQVDFAQIIGAGVIVAAISFVMSPAILPFLGRSWVDKIEDVQSRHGYDFSWIAGPIIPALIGWLSSTLVGLDIAVLTRYNN